MSELIERLKKAAQRVTHRYECSGESGGCDCGADELHAVLHEARVALAPVAADDAEFEETLEALKARTFGAGMNSQAHRGQDLSQIAKEETEALRLIYLQSRPPVQEGPKGVIEAVTKAIVFEDCGNTEQWQENINLGNAAVKAMRPHIQFWRDDAFRAAAEIATRYGADECIALDILALASSPAQSIPAAIDARTTTN